MVNARLRKKLIKLLSLVASDSAKGQTPTRRLGSVGWFVPDDSLPPDSDSSDVYVWLSEEEQEAYWDCLAHLRAESASGTLEHMDEREITEMLQRAVSDVFLDTNLHSLTAVKEYSRELLSKNSRPPMTWTVLWEIQHLALDADITVGDVDFVRLDLEEDTPWIDLQTDPFSEELKSLEGSSFARTHSVAGTRQKAIDRAVPRIDDALDVLRVAISSLRFVPEAQRLQRRGLHYFVSTDGAEAERIVGMKRGFEPLEFRLSEQFLPHVRDHLSKFDPLFGDELPTAIRDRIHRAAIYLGSSSSRDNLDLRCLDLVTSLETVLCAKNDQRKAETISLRYLLLLLSEGEPSYVTNPLSIYRLYLLRNDIIHGSARRIATEESYRELRQVAKDSITRMLSLTSKRPQFRSMSDVFKHLQSPATLAESIVFIEKHDVSNEAVKRILSLAESWRTE